MVAERQTKTLRRRFKMKNENVNIEDTIKWETIKYNKMPYHKDSESYYKEYRKKYGAD